jgi:hypothetical protein
MRAGMGESELEAKCVAALLENTAREVGIAVFDPTLPSIHLHQARSNRSAGQ